MIKKEVLIEQIAQYIKENFIDDVVLEADLDFCDDLLEVLRKNKPEIYEHYKVSFDRICNLLTRNCGAIDEASMYSFLGDKK